MFMGSYDHSLDTKGRMIIPSKFREALGERFVITKSLDHCLCIYDMAAWERFVQKLSGLPYNTRKQRELVRFFLSGASEVEPDKQGRVLLTQNLRDHAHITKDVILMGVGARIEIWNPATYEAEAFSDDMNEIAEELLGNGFEI